MDILSLPAWADHGSERLQGEQNTRPRIPKSFQG